MNNTFRTDKPSLLFLIVVCIEQRVSQYYAAVMVVLFGRYSSRITPHVSQKTVHMTFPAKMLVLNFVGDGSLLAFQTIDCFLVGGVKWWTYVSSPVMMRNRNLILFCAYCVKKFIPAAIRCCLCYCFSWCSTYRTATSALTSGVSDKVTRYEKLLRNICL